MFSKNTAQNSGKQPRAEKGGVKGFLAANAENKVFVTLVALSTVLGLSLLTNLILLLNNRALATRDTIYVQTPDGLSIEAQEFAGHERQADNIRRTVATWVQLTFEWDNQIPGEDPEAVDEGFEVEGETVPTKAYLASYLLEDGFRRSFLQELGTLVPLDVYSGNRQSVVRFFSISNPRQVAQGRWEVDIVTSRIERLDGIEDTEVNFNRTITLEAVPPVSPALGDEEPSAWRRQVYELAQNGLIITDVIPLSVN